MTEIEDDIVTANEKAAHRAGTGFNALLKGTQSIEAEKLSTGIADLDHLLGGGLPNGSMILLSGNPGAGKTILATQFLYDGAAKHGEKVVYVSFAEKREQYLRNMLTLGMDIKALEQKGLFSFLNFMVMTETGMRATIQTIKTRGSSHERRVVPFEITRKGMVVHE